MPEITIPLDDVSLGERQARISSRAAFEDRIGSKTIKVAVERPTVIEGPTFHALLGAVHLAWEKHLPLVLSPDVVWLAILQGLAIHVRCNERSLRSLLVPHTGKVRLVEIEEPPRSYDWGHAFEQLARKARERLLQPWRTTLDVRFTSTTELARVAHSVALMDVLSPYFEYEFRPACGIPYVDLEGTVEDWELLRERTLALADLRLSWWTEALEPVFDGFVQAARGDVNRPWWKLIYTRLSGCPHGISGWITALVPYLWKRGTFVRNGWLGRVEESSFGGVFPDDLPSGLSRAPFTCAPQDLTPPYACEAISGFAGIDKDARGRVRPVIGWAVRRTG